ncbi:MAG: leucine-rich repeat domain-containing protein [Verrucomicrobia bacterium]|nr:leucine-rich repeat domain-containing protein [Verrucomicrobiota bacterium]
MRTNFLAVGWLVAVLWCGSTLSLTADQYGDFTYEDHGTHIEITDYPTTATGPVAIPSEIVGKPVTGIGDDAFFRCAGLTVVTIPDNVTSIGGGAFAECGTLTTVVIGNGVTMIGFNAFYGCASLTSVAIPDNVLSIGNWAFYGCSGLTSVTLGSKLTSLYYFNGMAGFTAPTWKGCPSVNMGAPSPWPPWLLAHGFPYNANVLDDPNHDGVSLLMAYALALDPSLNLAGNRQRQPARPNLLRREPRCRLCRRGQHESGRLEPRRRDPFRSRPGGVPHGIRGHDRPAAVPAAGGQPLRTTNAFPPALLI